MPSNITKRYYFTQFAKFSRVYANHVLPSPHLHRNVASTHDVHNSLSTNPQRREMRAHLRNNREDYACLVRKGLPGQGEIRIAGLENGNGGGREPWYCDLSLLMRQRHLASPFPEARERSRQQVLHADSPRFLSSIIYSIRRNSARVRVLHWWIFLATVRDSMEQHGRCCSWKDTGDLDVWGIRVQSDVRSELVW